jgi:hypothetical protein
MASTHLNEKFNVKRRYFISGRLKSWYLIADTSTLSYIWRLSPYILSLQTIPECTVISIPECTVISFGKRRIIAPYRRVCYNGSISPTLTAMLYSTVLTLVFLCQQTLLVDIVREHACLLSRVDALSFFASFSPSSGPDSVLIITV